MKHTPSRLPSVRIAHFTVSQYVAPPMSARVTRQNHPGDQPRMITLQSPMFATPEYKR